MAEDDRRLISCAVSVAPVVKWQLYGKVISRVFLGLRPVHLKILTFENVGTLSFSIFSEFGYVTDFFYVPDFFYVFLKNQGKHDKHLCFLLHKNLKTLRKKLGLCHFALIFQKNIEKVWNIEKSGT